MGEAKRHVGPPFGRLGWHGRDAPLPATASGVCYEIDALFPFRCELCRIVKIDCSLECVQYRLNWLEKRLFNVSNMASLGNRNINPLMKK